MRFRRLLLALLAAVALISAGAVVQFAQAAETETCDDNVDNDGDGKVDLADPDCDEPTVKRCNDGKDNDGDGKIDYEAPDGKASDPGCSSTNDDSEWDLCADGKDNDGDGDADAADSQCEPGGGGEKPSACNDGKDNDGDGKTDYPNDKGCSNQFDGSEKYVCEDGTDNDADGKKDYPNDPGCSSATDNSEADPPSTAESCADGIDNDRDGLTDLDDPDCEEPAQCQDGTDNADPEDTLADEDDPGCHTDGDATNPDSYDPEDTDETDEVAPAGPCHRHEGILGPDGTGLASDPAQQNPLGEQAWHLLGDGLGGALNHPGEDEADSDTDNSSLGDLAELYVADLPLQLGPEAACALDLVLGTADDN